MSLRPALLALISAGPLTGYDAAKRFGASVGHLWNAPDSQIYPALRRMQEEGLLEAREVPWGRKHATKTEYSITPAGRLALAEWQSTPLSYTAERDQAHLLAAYFEWAPAGEARRRLLEHIENYEAVREIAEHQMRDIRERTSPTLQQRLAVSPPEEWDRIVAFKLFAYEGKVDRATTEIAWARRGLALLDEQEGGGEGSPRPSPDPDPRGAMGQ